MAIKSLKSGLLSREAAVGNAIILPGDYESIATITVGSGGTSSIEFTSIPSTFTHLQIRSISKSTRNDTYQENIYYSFNASTSAIYTQHVLSGNGSTASSYGGADKNGLNVIWGYTANDDAANVFGSFVTDILDYTNTNKYKTMRTLSGYDTASGTVNRTGYITFASGVWQNTAAITSIKLQTSQIGWKEYSHFALYGIRG